MALILASVWENPGVILALLVAAFGLIALTAFLIKKFTGIKKGSVKGSNETVATLTRDQLREIAEIKLPDLNCYTVEDAMKIVEGTALNMGVKVEK